jgi:plasmid stabilization system protein ParE
MKERKYFLSRQAVLDIREIVEYIARDSINNARQFTDKLMEICDSIGDFSERCRIVPEVRNSQIREIIYRNYRIVCTVQDKKVYILQIFNAARLFRMMKT